METINFYYENPEQLKTELESRKISGGANVLVQVFTGVINQQHTIELIKALRSCLPGTPVLGATSGGELMGDHVSDRRTVISVSRFRNAHIRSSLKPQGDGSMYDVGQDLAQELLPDPGQTGEKVFIVFTDGTSFAEFGSQKCLNGIHERRPDVPVAGGAACNAEAFDQNFGVSTDLGVTWVFTERGLTTRGAAGASIISPGLRIHRDVNLGWKTIGKKMSITEVEPQGMVSVVKSIDGLPPLDVYRKYFGDRVADGLPLSAINFPFIVKRDGMELAASPVRVFDDGSIVYTAVLQPGEKIQFGFGEPGLVLNESVRIARTIADYPHPVEGLFVYSCATRRKQLDHIAASELAPFRNIAPLSGFLTGGEFFHTDKANMLIGQTMTILSLSEAPLDENEHHTKVELDVERSKSIDSMLAIQTLVQRMTEELEEEQRRSENLLLNVLPGSIAERLKAGDTTIAERFDSASVIFADIVGFTELSSKYPPEEVVRVLNDIFSAFDVLVEKHGLEKIKTIGDAYMVAGGIPVAADDHAVRCARMGLDMLDTIDRFRTDGLEFLNIRVGLHTGPIVAGVLGSKKFAYDLWGDTVNTASRMESSGSSGRLQVTEAVHELLQSHSDFAFEERGEIEVKGKGKMRTFFLDSAQAGVGV